MIVSVINKCYRYVLYTHKTIPKTHVRSNFFLTNLRIKSVILTEIGIWKNIYDINKPI